MLKIERAKLGQRWNTFIAKNHLKENTFKIYVCVV